MKRLLFPLLALALAVVGCSSSSSPPPAPTVTSASTTPGPAPTGPLSTARLQAAALKLSDLPYGWAPSPPSTVNSVTASCAAINSDATKHMPAHVEAVFQQAEEGPFMQEILASGSPEQVQAAWESFRTAAPKCAPSPHLAPVSFPAYGDASYALTLTTSPSGVTFSGDVVVVRRGQVLVEVVAFGMGGVSSSLVRQLVGKCLAKI